MYWTHWIQPESSILNDWELSELEPFMLDTKVQLIPPIPKEDISETQNNQDQKSLSIDNDTNQKEDKPQSLYEKCKSRLLYVERCQDPVFWCLYIYHHGMKEYIRIGKHNGNEEMKIKKQIVDQMLQIGSKQMTQLLDTKFTKVGCGKMAEDILTKPKTTMDLIYPYCLHYNCNIYVVDLKKKIFLKYLFKGESDNTTQQIDTIILYKNPETKYPEYFLDMQEQLHSLTYIHSQFLGLDSYARPLKAVSNYKSGELIDLANRLGIETEKKKKNELYQAVSQYCAWDL